MWASSTATVSVAPRLFCLSFQSCREQPIIRSIMEVIPFKATGAFFFWGGGVQALLRSLHKILPIFIRPAYMCDARPRLEASTVGHV